MQVPDPHFAKVVTDWGQAPIFRLSSIQLDFFVKHAMKETGAHQPSDAGKVQGYVMKRVNKHATGKEVRSVTKKYLK